MEHTPLSNPFGVLLVDKPEEVSSFHLVHVARKRLGVKKIGHAGTLDPFASGLLILLIGKEWTRQQHMFMSSDKEYTTTILLGVGTDTYDREGAVVERSDVIPSLEEVHAAISFFQGSYVQTPPMYSAKKIGGKRLYELARQGIEVPRDPVEVFVTTRFLEYRYPYLSIAVECSKGTYIRTLGYDLAKRLGTCGHLVSLRRTKSGQFFVHQALSYQDFVERPVADIVKNYASENIS